MLNRVRVRFFLPKSRDASCTPRISALVNLVFIRQAELFVILKINFAFNALNLELRKNFKRIGKFIKSSVLVDFSHMLQLNN